MHTKFFKAFKRNKIGVFGLAILLFLSTVAVFAPFIAPYDPWDYSFQYLQQPSKDHLLGTNDIGQDIFSELLWSLRTSLLFGICVATITCTIGILVGISAAMISGIYDVVVMRIADALLAIPSILILILMAAYFKPSIFVLIITLSLTTWQTIARGIRAQTLSFKSRLHVKAAKNMGASTFYVMRKHIIPELFPLYAMGFITKARFAVFMEAGLSFLGMSDPTTKSLGIMISYATHYLYLDIWLNWLLPPVLSLSLIIISLAFVSCTVEELSDPRLRRDHGTQI